MLYKHYVDLASRTKLMIKEIFPLSNLSVGNGKWTIKLISIHNAKVMVSRLQIHIAYFDYKVEIIMCNTRFVRFSHHRLCFVGWKLDWVNGVPRHALGAKRSVCSEEPVNLAYLLLNILPFKFHSDFRKIFWNWTKSDKLTIFTFWLENASSGF